LHFDLLKVQGLAPQVTFDAARVLHSFSEIG
jgi:hypothetical protein